MQIDSKDISIVVQGPIVGNLNEAEDKQGTQACIDNLRIYLPKAEIIISTWEGSEVSHLNRYDQVVFSKDPGAITYNDYELKNVYNNNNRQIVSTSAGFNIASRKYAIKFRPDFRLENIDFLQYFGKFDKRKRYPFFKDRIVTCNLASRDYTKTPLLFAISDLFQFGNTEDLKNLWNIPLQPEPATTRAFPYEKRFGNDPFRYNQYKMQYSCEQYIWFAFVKKNHLDLSLDYFCQIPLVKIIPSIYSIFDNFVIIDFSQLGLIPPGRLIHSEMEMIGTKKWEYIYRHLYLRNENSVLWKEFLKTIKASFLQYYNNRK